MTSRDYPIRSIAVEDPDLPRRDDHSESSIFLGQNIWITLLLVVILFVTSQFWNSAAEEILEEIVGHRPRWYNNVVAAIIFTAILFILVRYVFKITLESFV